VIPVPTVNHRDREAESLARRYEFSTPALLRVLLDFALDQECPALDVFLAERAAEAKRDATIRRVAEACARRNHKADGSETSLKPDTGDYARLLDALGQALLTTLTTDEQDVFCKTYARCIHALNRQVPR